MTAAAVTRYGDPAEADHSVAKTLVMIAVTIAEDRGHAVSDQDGGFKGLEKTE